MRRNYFVIFCIVTLKSGKVNRLYAFSSGLGLYRFFGHHNLGRRRVFCNACNAIEGTLLGRIALRGANDFTVRGTQMKTEARAVIHKHLVARVRHGGLAQR